MVKQETKHEITQEAARAMLEACRDAIGHLEFPTSWQTDDDRRHAWLAAHHLRAAVAKAEGK